MPNYAIEVIAPGPIGPEGPPNVLEVGVVTLGLPTDPLIFQIVGDSPDQIVNVQIPRGFQGIQGIKGDTGNTGNTGPANTLDVVSVTALAAGAAPTVVITGAAPNQHLAFGIPAGAQGIQGVKGDTGNTGNTGPANSLDVIAVNTLAAGSPATVAISGAAPTQHLTFGIPAGAQGIQGVKGDKGDAGAGSVSTVNGDAGPAVVLTTDSIGDGATYGRITKTERTRLAGVESGAEVTSTAKVSAAGAYMVGGTDVPVTDGGTGRSTSTTAYGVLAAGTTATGAHQTIAPGTSGQFLKSAGVAALPTFATMIPSDVGAKKIWVCNATDTLASLVTLGMVTGDLIARRP